MNKKIIASNTLVAITALYILTNPLRANAISPTPAPLWQQVAKKLGIGTDKVQIAFEEIRQQRQDQHLEQLVTDGKLTQTQANALKTKQKEWRDKLVAIRRERDDWFKSQDIDTSLFNDRGGMMRGREMGRSMR